MCFSQLTCQREYTLYKREGRHVQLSMSREPPLLHDVDVGGREATGQSAGVSCMRFPWSHCMPWRAPVCSKPRMLALTKRAYSLPAKDINAAAVKISP